MGATPDTWLRERAAEFDHLGAPLYGVLARGMAQDWESGGVLRTVLAGWEGAPSDAVVDLRLLGGLYRLVLERRAPLLAPYYRTLGGTARPEGAWEVARDVVAEHVDELRTALEIVPQTNETGRAAALVAGILDACSRTGLRRVRLLELGASAGLNLRVDRFHITGDGWSWGPAGSPVQLVDAVRGPVRPDVARVAREVEVVGRRGCDLHPVDPTTAEGRTRLTSFVWPDHVDRHDRLAAALAVAEEVPGPVDRAHATAWLREQLSAPAGRGVLTVVWHSVVMLYLPDAEQAGLAEVLADAGRRGPVVRVGMEHPSLAPGVAPEVAVTLHPDGGRRVLADASHHGPPVVLRPGVAIG